VLRVMKIVAVEHMDDVLRNALKLEHPETFLREPSRAVDWRDEQKPAAPTETPAPPTH
jgi:hypothetical protein